MIISYEWLKEYIDFDLTPEELVEKLTMSGTEVEGITYLAEGISNVVTARVSSIREHPETDKLLVCSVDTGEGEYTVITAAKNLSAGDMVPFAKVGSTLPGGKGIGLAEFKGITSQGMLVSAQELGLEKESTGIMVLPADTPLNEGIQRVVGLDDWAIELKVTPNRPDCLGMIGIAREIAAITGNSIKLPESALAEKGADVGGQVAVGVADPDLCPRYTARVIHGIEIKPSPQWMQERLRAVGVRPINNVVDITNYVMLEYNQPLHAFDLRDISGSKITVRRANTGEQMVTLDGVTRELTPDMLLITDGEGPVALAGVMGGLNSEVKDDTASVLLESACFERVNIWRTSKVVKLRTEASSRYEKGLDPENCAAASARAAYLLQEYAGGTVAPGIVDVYEGIPEPVRVPLRPSRVAQVLGIGIPEGDIARILSSLGFDPIIGSDGAFDVGIPTYRKDVSQEADLVEEVGRIYGYDNIEGTLPRGISTIGGVSRSMSLEDRCIDYLVDAGFSETLTYAFVSPKVHDRLGLPEGSQKRKHITISNPMTEEFSVMRTSLLGSILTAVEYNVSRRVTDLALFESARIYLPADPMPVEQRTLAGVIMGTMGEPGWNRTKIETDFFDLKGIILGLLESIGVIGVETVQTLNPSFHPGRAADLHCDGVPLGTMGELHPAVGVEYGLPKRGYGFELNLDAVFGKATKSTRYVSIPKYPAMKRDLAILVGLDVPASSVEAIIRREAGDMLESVSLFDRYMGKQVPEGYQSMAYSITYRLSDRTMTDDEANGIQDKVETALGQELGAKIRS